MSDSDLELVREAFAALAEDDIERGLAVLADEIEFQPLGAAKVEGEIYRGHDDIRRWAGERSQALGLAFEPEQLIDLDGSVLVHGHIRSSRVGGAVALDTPVSWVFDIADGKIGRIRVFLEAADAEAAARAQ